MRKYKQPYSLRKYFDDEVIDRVHNALKHNMCIKKYQIYLKPLRKKRNGHKTKVYEGS